MKTKGKVNQTSLEVYKSQDNSEMQLRPEKRSYFIKAVSTISVKHEGKTGLS